MEDFVVSARKYRPKSFESVVGQESITNTLLKAIEGNHLAQAFLFCGPRGVGKTTCARILARMVNQFGQSDSEDNQEYAFNIFELDAASNNTVDDIRNLIDQVRIPPQIGKYKVYIIDEVHMLSSSAFNAFLKTLEEPPPYAIFIMATTEKNKVLPTILSRCQIFDFHRIQIPDMVRHLAGIAEKEGIEVESDALHIIAEKADGALRDALSIFDQIAGFAGNKISYEDVINNLNILDYDYYFNITESFLKGDKASAILAFNEILNNGFDGHNFINGLANHMRNLLFCTSERTAAIMEVGDNVKSRYLEQAAQCDTRFLLNALNTLSEADINYKSSRNHRLLVEITLLKLCSLAEKLGEKKNFDFDDVNTSIGPSGQTAKVGQVLGKPANVTEKKTEKVVDENPKPVEPEEPAATKESVGIILNQEESEIQAEAAPEIASLEKDNQDYTSAKAELHPKPEGLSDPMPPAKTAFSSRLGKSKSTGLPSLSALAKQEVKQSKQDVAPNDEGGNEESVLHANRPARDFNLAQLWEAWNSYALRIKEEDRQSYYATLTKNKPIMREKFKIEFLVDNHVQKSDLDTDKVVLLEYLREQLQNWSIQFEAIIDEEEREDGESLYDPHRIFEVMNEKNPNLLKMKQMFDLEVDHDS